MFTGDESTWNEWSFKLRSYVSVVDLELGRVMEAAELAVAHAYTWVPLEPLSQTMDAQLRYMVVVQTSGSALQIIRQKPSGVQEFRDLTRRCNPRSQARSLARLQEIIQSDFGHDPSSVTDRLVVFERLVVEYECFSGEQLGVQVKCVVLLESSTGTTNTSVAHLRFKTGLRRHETDSGELLGGETVMTVKPSNDNGRSANGSRCCVQ